MSEPVEEPSRPQLRIVRGDPTAEEVAALVSVVSALAATPGGDRPGRRRSEWAAPHRRLRSAPAPGWRSSTLP